MLVWWDWCLLRVLTVRVCVDGCVCLLLFVMVLFSYVADAVSVFVLFADGAGAMYLVLRLVLGVYVC